MQFHIRMLNIEGVSLGVVWLSEVAGGSQAFGVPLSWIGIPFTSVGFTLPLIVQIPFLFLWCLIQVIISFFLIIQAWDALMSGDKAKVRFLNMTVICIVIQCVGFFQSPQLFGAAVAITNGLFLYVHQQSETTQNMRRIITKTLAQRQADHEQNG